MDTIFVKEVHPGSAAHQAGLKKGDRLLAVNGMPVAGTHYAQVVALIQQTPKTLTLQVVPQNFDLLQTVSFVLPFISPSLMAFSFPSLYFVFFFYSISGRLLTIRKQTSDPLPMAQPQRCNHVAHHPSTHSPRNKSLSTAPCKVLPNPRPAPPTAFILNCNLTLDRVRA